MVEERKSEGTEDDWEECRRLWFSRRGFGSENQIFAGEGEERELEKKAIFSFLRLLRVRRKKRKQRDFGIVREKAWKMNK